MKDGPDKRDQGPSGDLALMSPVGTPSHVTRVTLNGDGMFSSNLFLLGFLWTMASLFKGLRVYGTRNFRPFTCDFMTSLQTYMEYFIFKTDLTIHWECLENRCILYHNIEI